MGQAFIILVAVLVGLAIGAFVGRILAREGARSEFDKRNADAERRALTAEAAVPELRAQLIDCRFNGLCYNAHGHAFVV